MNTDKFFKELSKHEKSKLQEKKVAKQLGGFTTVNSGAVFGDGDVKVKKYKIVVEAKRTDKNSIRLEKGWLEKVKLQSRFDIPVLHIQIQDEEWYVIRPQEMGLIIEYLKMLGG